MLISSLSCRKFVWDNPYDSINAVKEPASLKDGLVAYFPFNGNAKDESGNNFNGIVNKASLANDRFNNTNQAYNFDVNSNIIVPLDNNRFKSDFTISIWVYLDELSKTFDYPTFMKSQNPSFYFQFVLFKSGLNEKISFYFIGNPGTAQQIVDGAVNGPFNSYNKWYHVVLANKGKVNELYIDGLRYSVSNGASQIQGLVKETYVQFGSAGFLPFESFIGKLDDIRLYNRLLTQEEITYLSKN
jgi:hypothetical protein